MKIIFLDIDGVLNVHYKGKRDEYGQAFHPNFVENLREVIDKTGAKIVISSTWRMSGLKIMQEMWEHRGLPGEVIDITPIATSIKLHKRDEDCNENISIPRGLEIEAWLGWNDFQRINWSKDKQLEYLEKSKVKNYVILDDDSDMLYNQKEHFVKCSGRGDEPDHESTYGFTTKAKEEAIEILNKNLIELYYD